MDQGLPRLPSFIKLEPSLRIRHQFFFGGCFFHEFPLTLTRPQPGQLVPACVYTGLLLLPIVFFLCTLLADLVNHIRPLKSFSSWLTLPFRDFLQLEDVAEYDATDPVLIKVPSWKRWALVILSSLMWLQQSVLVILVLVRRDHINVNPGLIIILAWVSR